MAVDKVNFIQESILELLRLDHESYDLLFSEVRDICEQYSVSLDEMDFKDQLFCLINDKKVKACLYDDEAHDLVSQEFDLSKFKEYWFRGS